MAGILGLELLASLDGDRASALALLDRGRAIGALLDRLRPLAALLNPSGLNRPGLKLPGLDLSATADPEPARGEA